LVGSACTALRNDGRPCRATPLIDEPFCFWHAPQTAEEAAEARRLGGLHRRKKKSVAAIYGFAGLRTISDSQTLLETAAIETLAIENSINRNRTLATFVSTAAKLIELGELADRVAALEAAALASRASSASDDPFAD
jgi:hypothetical protein